MRQRANAFVFPPFMINNSRFIDIINPDSLPEEMLNVPAIDPLKIKFEDELSWYQFPLDPVISVGCKNIIVRRNVLKNTPGKVRRGTVKELWSQDDFEIQIAGLFQNPDADAIPEDHIRKLRNYCEAGKIVEVQSALLSIFNINRMVIEDYNFPHTRGMANQMFSLKCYSDDNFDLLIELEG